MGFISKYRASEIKPIKPIFRPKPPEMGAEKSLAVLGVPIRVPETITIAEEYKEVKEVLVAHNVADYRQHGFSLLLLPSVHIAFDTYLEGSDGIVPTKSVQQEAKGLVHLQTK